MMVQANLWQLAGMFLGMAVFFLTVIAFLGRLLVKQFKEHVDEKFAGWNKQFAALDADMRKLERDFLDWKARMPLDYQLRNDAIRQEVGIISRLDGLAGIIERVREKQ